jgi:hypothetical protein
MSQIVSKIRFLLEILSVYDTIYSAISCFQTTKFCSCRTQCQKYCGNRGVVFTDSLFSFLIQKKGQERRIVAQDFHECSISLAPAVDYNCTISKN